MTSTTGSHGNIKRYRGVYVIDYALLAGKSDTNILQKHAHHPSGSFGALDGCVLLGVSIEAGNQHECSSPRGVNCEPNCDAPLPSRQGPHGINKTIARPIVHH
jgi:hypothetical protein